MPARERSHSFIWVSRASEASFCGVRRKETVLSLLLLAVIYLSFICLGLPDSLLGAAWPEMYRALDCPLSAAGLISMFIAGGTVLSSLFSDQLLRRFGTGRVIASSVLMTAVGLIGFSCASSCRILYASAVPCGLGAGAADAALNHYAAVHLKARHMNWLYCFWGIGAAVSPYIMSMHINRGADWQGGYRAVGALLLLLTALLYAALPLWKSSKAMERKAASPAPAGTRTLLRRREVRSMLLTFFCYSALESTAGLWASSYLVQSRGLHTDLAAQCGALFFVGITAGRLLSGFFSEQLGDRRMMQAGLLGITAGIALMLLPVSFGSARAGLLMIGFGCAPVYPSLIHLIPVQFGDADARKLIGLQMASAYLGTALMPPVFGLAANELGTGLLPMYLLLFLLMMAALSVRSRGGRR